MRPCGGCSKPASIRIKVVFPHPDGPRREKNSRSWISRDTSSTAVNSPKRLVTFSNRMSGTEPGSAQGANLRRTPPMARWPLVWGCPPTASAALMTPLHPVPYPNLDRELRTGLWRLRRGFGVRWGGAALPGAVMQLEGGDDALRELDLAHDDGVRPELREVVH